MIWWETVLWFDRKDCHICGASVHRHFRSLVVITFLLPNREELVVPSKSPNILFNINVHGNFTFCVVFFYNSWSISTLDVLVLIYLLLNLTTNWISFFGLFILKIWKMLHLNITLVFHLSLFWMQNYQCIHCI